MSFEIARQIISNRRTAGTLRINNAMKTAYNEALQEYKSVAEARKAAIEVLEEQKKYLNKYEKILNEARENVRKGEIDIAKRAFEVNEKNLNLEAQYKLSKAIKSMADQPDASKLRQARMHAGSVTNPIEGLEIQNFEKLMAEIEKGFGQSGDKNLTAIKAEEQLGGLVQGTNLKSAIKNFRTKTKKKEYETLIPKYRKGIKEASLKYHLLNDLESRDFTDKESNKKHIKDWIESQFIDVENISEANISKAYQDEMDAYLKTGKKSRRLSPPRYLKAPKSREFTQEELLLASEAEPIFEMLRKTDDSPFELTDVEMAQIGKEAKLGRAFRAYSILQKMIPNAPQLVTREEELLLDKIALERQLDIYKTEDRIGKLQPEMRSTSSIKRRAAEIADPKTTKNQELAKLSPQAQKFYATQKQALELADKSDSDLLNGSIGQKTGVLLYKKHFDPVNKTYRNGSNYDAVVSDITNEFPDAESQLQAIASFNSRAMALQRSNNPIILPDGKEDKFYQKALKSFGIKMGD